MRKKLARILLQWARRLDKSVVYNDVPTARPMGICVHISKKDVRGFRKEHPQVKSHREGLKLLIDEAKWRIAGAIGRGMVEKKVIDFDVRKTPYVADVYGIAYLYTDEKETTD